jgi:hypothetical protein
VSEILDPLYYTIRPQGIGRSTNNVKYTITADGLDKIVFNKLREHLQNPESEQQFANYTAVEGQVVSEASLTLIDIERDIVATKALMERILGQVRSGKLTEPDLLDAANQSYQRAKEELERLESRKGQTTLIAHEDEERRSYTQLMQEVGEAWEEVVMPEDYPRMAYLFIKSVTVEIMSPTFFSLEIAWQDPGWEIDKGVCFKGERKQAEWTAEEVAILLERFQTAPRKELTERLPRRSYIAMRSYFKDHGMKIPSRPGRKREDGVPYHVCLEDWKVMQAYGITEGDWATWGGVNLVTWVNSHSQNVPSSDDEGSICGSVNLEIEVCRRWRPAP